MRQPAPKLFTKRTDRAGDRARFPGIRVDGDVELGERVLEMTSIIGVAPS